MPAIVSIVDILSGAAPLIVDVRQTGSGPGVDYSGDPDCWLFALSTHVAVVAKVVAALALPGAAQDISDGSVAVRQRLMALEDGRLFRGAGVANLLSGDFFAWYLDPPGWSSLEPTLELLLAGAAAIDFGPAGDRVFARDLFKGLYEDFVPAAVRHSLGEYNTPDWLAEHILDQSGWQPHQTLTDPTCGTGTFLLEALRRRLVASTGTGPGADAVGLLQGLAGFDINPLAVLAARASVVVALRDRLDPARPCHLPVYLADTINPARQSGGTYDHAIQTDRGVRRFSLPASLSRHEELSALFAELRPLVEADLQEDGVMDALEARVPSVARLDSQDRDAVRLTVASLVDLQAQGWNGIWCSILAERFSAAATPTAEVVAGNAPWVRWSNLPPEYAEFVKAHCADLGLLSDARWVGGIESDICTLVFHRAAEWCLAEHGLLVMLMTGTVFTTESAQGFRRFRPGTGPPLKVLAVEDFKEVAPFEGVSNHLLAA